MSTEWVPLSISTPPPLTPGCAFHRLAISTLDAKLFSNRMISPRMPDATMLFARTTSSTYRNFDAMVSRAPDAFAASTIFMASSIDVASGFSLIT